MRATFVWNMCKAWFLFVTVTVLSVNICDTQTCDNKGVRSSLAGVGSTCHVREGEAAILDLPFIPTLIRVVNQETSHECRDQVVRYLQELRNFTLWAVRMFDATAKLPAGVLVGSSYQLGNFDECVSVRDSVSNVRGLYCLAAMTLKPTVTSMTDSLSAWQELQETDDHLKLQKNKIYWATCVPTACSPADIERTLQASLQYQQLLKDVHISVTVSEEHCQDEEEVKHWKVPSIIWFMLATYVLFLITCTVLDGEPQNTARFQFSWRNFSLRSGWRTLMAPEASTPDRILCFRGLRVYTTLLIVLGHRGEMLASGPMVHDGIIEGMYHDLFGCMITNGHLIVETFFTITGYLICMNALRSGPTFSAARSSVYRYMRLTPAYAVVIAFHAFVLYGLSSGPLWKWKVGRERENCLNNWWTNLLYINNYVNPDHPCVDPSWYLACDIQLFILASTVASIIRKTNRKGVVILIVPILASIVIPAVITYSLGLDPTIIPRPEILGMTFVDSTYQWTYVTAYCRAGPVFVGMAFGYMLHFMKRDKASIPKVVLYTCWPLSFLVPLSVTGCSYFFYQHRRISPLLSATYAGLHRSLFSLGIAFIIIACASGHGGFVNKFLSWSKLQLLSKISYCTFLVHPAVQFFQHASLRVPAEGNYKAMAWMGITDYLIASACGLMLYLSVEQPMTLTTHAFLARKMTFP